MKILAFIVIYNKECRDSSACSTIPPYDGVIVTVVDNSTVENDNLAYCQKKGWSYLSMGGNLGLSKAYNRALDESAGDGDLIVWFDDDTEICPDFFRKLHDHANANPAADIFLPVVTCGGVTISPSRLRRYRSRPVKDIADLRQSEITGINSGMAIRAQVFDDYRYTEDLFLDCIDHRFILDMRQRRKTVCIMKDVVLKQDLFSMSKTASFRQKRKRMASFEKDFFVFCQGTLAGYGVYGLSYVYRRIMLLIREAGRLAHRS